jgi:hypothetical protein
LKHFSLNDGIDFVFTSFFGEKNVLLQQKNRKMKLRCSMVMVMTALSSWIYGQTPVNVYESTVKIEKQSTHEYLCGLAEGDQLIFSFNAEKGGKMDHVEILEYPSSTLFTDYKTSKIKQKTLTIHHTGIYLFRFTNQNPKEKVCRYTIQRMPATDLTARFNTTVYWKTIKDTVEYKNETETTLVTDTVVSNLTDKMVNIHALLNFQSNKMAFSYILPPQTIAYSYYIGVNQAGNKAFNDATASLLRSASPLVSAIPGYGPLAALALNGTSFLTNLSGGESVEYWITDAKNAILFQNGKPFKWIRQGNVVNDFSRLTAPLKGEYYVCLKNNNKLQSIDVTVKVTAVSLRQRKVSHPVKRYIVETKQIPYLKQQISGAGVF